MTPESQTQARQQMISQQLRCWFVLDERVLQAVEDVPRELFVPPDYRDLAFADTSIPLGHGHCMLAPKIEGRLLQALAIESQDVVLIIGAGSGYLPACAAKLAKRIRCIELNADIARQARQNLLAATINNVSIDEADGTQLNDSNAYDAILVSGSLPLYDMRFERALKPGGRLVIITGSSPIMQVLRIIRSSDNQWQREVLFETDVPPLQHATKPPAFVF